MTYRPFLSTMSLLSTLFVCGSVFSACIQTAELTEPEPISGISGDSIVAGQAHACVLRGSELYCWGWDDSGQVGLLAPQGMMTEPQYLTPQLVETDVVFTHLTAGESHTCGLTDGGEAYCWGNNKRGQLGIAENIDTSIRPRPVIGEHRFQMLRAGANHTCGITVEEGQLFCWGDNRQGQLSQDREVTSYVAPIEVGTYVHVAPGGAHTCAVEENEKVFCWGANGRFQLGAEQQKDEEGDTFVSVQPIGVSLVEPSKRIFAGVDHTCVLDEAGVARCWGRNDGNQLGAGQDNESTADTRPVKEKLGFHTLALGRTHSCGIRRPVGTSETLCWGTGPLGRAGVQRANDADAPVDGTNLEADEFFTELAAGDEFSCALSTENNVYCWGNGENGRLGLGDEQNREIPTRLSFSGEPSQSNNSDMPADTGGSDAGNDTGGGG